MWTNPSSRSRRRLGSSMTAVDSASCEAPASGAAIATLPTQAGIFSAIRNGVPTTLMKVDCCLGPSGLATQPLSASANSDTIILIRMRVSMPCRRVLKSACRCWHDKGPSRGSAGLAEIGAVPARRTSLSMVCGPGQRCPRCCRRKGLVTNSWPPRCLPIRRSARIRKAATRRLCRAPLRRSSCRG